MSKQKETVYASLEFSGYNAKRKPLYRHVKNLSYTRTGYGKKIPTEWQVKYNNRWYRVYVCIYSNSGTCYISTKNQDITVHSVT